MMTDALDAYSAVLAREESDLAAADQAIAAAVAHVDLLRDRLASQDERLDKIRVDLANNRLSQKEAGGIAIICAADRADLEQMLASAETDVVSAQQAAHAARERRDMAQQAFSRATSDLEFRALSERVAMIDNALCDAVGRLFQVGVAAGRPRALSGIWRPSSRLSRAVSLGVAPTMESSE